VSVAHVAPAPSATATAPVAPANPVVSMAPMAPIAPDASTFLTTFVVASIIHAAPVASTAPVEATVTGSSLHPHFFFYKPSEYEEVPSRKNVTLKSEMMKCYGISYIWFLS
jgi:hypothetical protein